MIRELFERAWAGSRGTMESAGGARRFAMIKTVERGLLAGLGLVAISKDKLSALFDELVQRGELTREQSKKVSKLLHERGDLDSKPILNRVSRELDRLLSKSPFASRGEMRSLSERLEALERNDANAEDARAD